jgi:uncharacterized protein
MNKEAVRIESIPALVWGSPSDTMYLYVHGKMSSKEEAEGFADIANRKCCQVLSFDLPEHGERKDEPYACTVQNGVRDLGLVFDYAKHHWDRLSLFACSLGAYFSLSAFPDVAFDRCLFLSPILDMERLIQNMMKWCSVDEELLEEKREIPTPMGETISWQYYQYVKEHPIGKWPSETHILYGTRDNLTEKSVIDKFCEKFRCELETLIDGEHYFHTQEQVRVLNDWLERKL